MTIKNAFKPFIPIFALIVFPVSSFSSSLTPDPSFHPTPSVDVQVPGESNRTYLINDGSFENGECDLGSSWTCWTTEPGDVSRILDPLGVWGYPAYDGTYATWLGGFYGGNPVSNSVCQAITVNDSTLTFWWMGYVTDENSNWMYVKLDGDTVYSKLMTLADHTYGTWDQISVDVGAYVGGVHELCLEFAHEDGANMLVDYIELGESPPGSIVVCPDGTGDYLTIQDAIDAATELENVALCDGVFSGPGNFDLDFLGKTITVSSQSGNPESCILDGTGVSGPGVRFQAGEGPGSILTGLTVRNASGNAIYCESSSPTISNCIFSGNDGEGGAVYCITASPSFDHCTFLGNIGGDLGGGLTLVSSPSVVVDHCTFYGNSASAGGGIYLLESSLTVTNSIIAFNPLGEALSCSSSSASLVCCDLFSNEGGDWTGCISDQFGVDGNISINPEFCDPLGGDLTLSASSPCASENNPGCGQIGAFGVDCDANPVQMFTKLSQAYFPAGAMQTRGSAMCDIDLDGDVDLFVCHPNDPNRLYLNNGSAIFTAVTEGTIVTDLASSSGCSWGDYDNDGYPDLVVANQAGEDNCLYRNLGDGTFEEITSGPVVNDGGNSIACSWADANADGYLDLLIVNQDGQNDFFYLNDRAGGFNPVTTGEMVTDAAIGTDCKWGDIYGSGDLDLLVMRESEVGRQHHNLGGGAFDWRPFDWVDGAQGISLGDFNDDGYSDLFVAKTSSNNMLMINQAPGGPGYWAGVTGEPIDSEGLNSRGGSWADIDNDGDLDLFVWNAEGLDTDNYLYLNDGSGAFDKVTTGLLVNDPDPIQSTSACWGDVNNDGYLDLFLGNGESENYRDYIYLNTGGDNNWLIFECRGTVSNSSALGAKIRYLAVVGNDGKWQMREISGLSGGLGQNSLRGHFGLGGVGAMTLTGQIEWPSGHVTDLGYNLPMNQIHTFTEPDDVVANFGGEPWHTHVSVPMQFTDYSAGNPVSWEWDFEVDGVADSYEQNPTHVYGTSGSFSVSLDVSDGRATANKTRQDYISVWGDSRFQDFTADTFVHTASSSWPGQDPSWISDDRLGEGYCWWAGGDVPHPHWIQIDFGIQPVAANALGLIAFKDNWGSSLREFVLEASNDGVEFQPLHPDTLIYQDSHIWQTFQFENGVAYRFYRLTGLSNWDGNDFMGIEEWELGWDDSPESPFVIHPDGSGDFATIQEAVNAAWDGYAIELADGVYTGPGNRDIDFMGKAITIHSQSGDPDSCVIDCEGSIDDQHRGFHFHSGEGVGSVLQGVTIKNGYLVGSGDGGGVLCEGSASPAISNCVFSWNSAESSGGLACLDQASPTLVDCIFVDNYAVQDGGGLGGSSIPPPTLEGCEFRRNQAETGHGGGLFWRDSPIALTNCTFSDNSAGSAGGGVKFLNATAPILTNCTIVSNTGINGTGGVDCENTSPTMDNMIIAFNAGGGAIDCSGGVSNPIFTCSDLFGNEYGDWIDCIASQNGMDGNIAANPRFCDRLNGEYSLQEYSPCSPDSNPSCGLIGAWPVACGNQPPEFACCLEDGCQILREVDCIAAGGEWMDGAEDCVTDSCPWIVNPLGTGDYPTIQAAIDAAANGQVIRLSAGTYSGAGNRDLSFQGKTIILESFDGNPEACIIDCGGSEAEPHYGIYFASSEIGPETVVAGITFQNAYFTPWGGAIRCESSSPSLTNCIFLENSSGAWGGGVYLRESSSILTDCQFISNDANQSGGGVYNYTGYDASPSLIRCTFSYNGKNGMVSVGGAPSITDCVFLENTRSGLVCDGSPIIQNCLFSGNTSTTKGGGLRCGSSSDPQIIGCTFAKNSALQYGGAICADYASSPSISNCTFYGNSAPYGAALFSESNASLTLDNSVVAFNLSGGAIECEAGGSATLTCSDVFGNVGGDWVGCVAGQNGSNGNISADPLFCDPDDGDFSLRDDSPCLTENNPSCELIGAWPVGCIEAIFSAEPYYGQAPLSVQFADLTPGSYTGREWDFQCDGVVDDSILNPSFAYTAPGLYSVGLKVYSGNDLVAVRKKENHIHVLTDNNMIVHATEIVTTDPAPVPIAFAGQDSLGAISLFFDYDAAKLVYVGIETYVPDEYFLGGVVGDQISVQWFDETGGSDPIIPGVDPDTLFAIMFTPVMASDTTHVVFDNAQCLLGDKIGNTIPDVGWIDEDPFGRVITNVGAVVSGRVGYFWLDSPVPGACLSMGPPNPDVWTDVQGLYGFDRYPYGYYALNITKDSDTGGINSLDALKVIRHSTGQEPFNNAYKLRAADVNLDELVNALDAIKIVRAAVVLEDLLSGDWSFDPDSVEFSPLNADQLVDFVAIRMGDVNGDWTTDGRGDPVFVSRDEFNDAAISVSSDLDGAHRNLQYGKDGDRETVVLAFPDTTITVPNPRMEMPLLVSEFNDIGAISLRVTFIDSILEFVDIVSKIDGVNFVSNLVGNEIRLEWYDMSGGANPISIGTDTLLAVGFLPLGEDGETSPIQFTDACTVGDAFGDPLVDVVFVDGSCTLSDEGTAVDTPQVHLFRIRQNYPNPFNPSTEIQFRLPTPESVSLRIFDLSGRCIRELISGEALAAGAHTVAWDGMDASGRQVASGVYFARLDAGKQTATMKMTLLK